MPNTSCTWERIIPKIQVVNDTLSKLLTLHRFENDGWSLVDI